MSIIIPAIRKNSYHITPVVRWQSVCEGYLEKLLRDYPFRNPEACPRFSYFRLGAKGRTQIAQVWDENWTLHVQCAWRPDDADTYKLRDSQALVSLDVEPGGGGFNAIPVQRAVLEVISPIATSTLADMATTRTATRSGHHLVWEIVPFAPDSEDSIRFAADRMALYMRLLFPTATQALHDWAGNHGAVVEILETA